MSSISFDRIADRYDATRGGLSRGRHAAVGVAPWIVGRRLLEVGLGTGVVAHGLRERGFRPVGVDLSAAMLLQAVARLGPVAAQADGYHLPVADRAVDTVYLVWVLQLVPDRPAFLAETARIVRPGGRVIIVPSHQETVDDDVDAVAQPLHVWLRPERQDAAEIVRWGTGAGLHHVATDATPDDIYDRSPNDEADRLEQRSYSSMWRLSDADYQWHVAPVVTRLRAMPEPDRPRARRSRCAVVVLERT